MSRIFYNLCTICFVISSTVLISGHAIQDGRETGNNLSTTANPDGREIGDNMSAAGKTEISVGSGAVIGSVIAALAVGVIIGVICTFFILTRKGFIAGSKTQPTVSHEKELTEPPTALDTYEQLRNRTDTEIRGTYDSLEVNSGVQPNSQSQYESLNQDAEKYHTYTDLKQSR
ncbi:uncharacterized protein LOC132751731 [Ruditapes philippinarum]|uniref:uncharacterized protein LOC132751731 n=1 Tax=Ruditapes philippinarum TaxID=129788 RepID=UPI00295C336F|nr:uncharacterized protein LOC132751731 [Ruditapes philippinarum]